MEFNKKEYMAKMQPSVDKLVANLLKKGIEFSQSDGDMNNVVFTSSLKTMKMSHHSLYRFSGICCVYKDKGENSTEAIEVTDEMYLNTFMKTIIERFFELK